MPIREVVPLPAGFPDEPTDRIDAGEIGIVDSFLRPTGQRAAEACDTLVAMIVSGQFLSNYDSEWMFQQREMMLPKLQEAYARMADAGEAKPRQLMEVRRFLWLLGAPEGSRWMAEALEVAQPQKNEQLDDLRSFVNFRAEKAPLMADEPLVAALRLCWQDPKTRDDAFTIGLGLNLPEASEALLQALGEPGKFPGVYNFGKGWSISQQETAIRAIARRLETADEEETVDLLRALGSAWINPVDEENVSPQMQQQALQVAEDFFLNPARAHREKAIEVLRSKGTARCLAEAERLAFESRDDSAILLYARVAGDRLRSDFIDLLNDPKSMHSVLRALGQLPPRQLRPEWAAPVAAKLTAGIDQKKGVLKILARMGMVGVEEARKHEKTLPMQLNWIERGLNLQAAANDLVRLGLVDSAPVIEPSLDPNDSEGLQKVLHQAGILFGFDAEHDFIPPPHHALLMKAAASSRGKFAPLHARQYWRDANDQNAGYVVEFAQDGKLIRFSADYLGDWYDVMAVLKGANFALEKKGLPDRFVIWSEMDQVCTVIFGPLDKLQEFARLYALPLDVSSADLTEEDGGVHHHEVSKEHEAMMAGLMKRMEAAAQKAKKGPAEKPGDQGSLLIRIFGFLVIAAILSFIRSCSHH
jgi:hypothetical protein